MGGGGALIREGALIGTESTGPYWNEGAYSTGMFVRIGALVSKNFF